MENMHYIAQTPKEINIGSSKSQAYGVLMSGSESTYRTTEATSISDTAVSFNIIPGSINSFMMRKTLIRMKMRLEFVGTSQGPGIPLLGVPGMRAAIGIDNGIFATDSMRAYPLSEMCKTVTCEINNLSLTTELQRYARIMQRYGRDVEEMAQDLSTTPSMPDNSFNYDSLVGTNINPLADYSTNPLIDPRGGFQGCLLTRNDSTGLPGDRATIEVTFTEPLNLSPFKYSRGDESLAFIMVDSMNLTLNFGSRGNSPFGLLASVFSHSPTAGGLLTSGSATILSASCFNQYISPDPMASVSMPSEINYSYFQPVTYITQSNVPLNPGDTFVFTSNSMSLGQIPNNMNIWVDELDNLATITTTNSYLSITNVNISMGNRDGILANCPVESLYEISRKNGCNLTYDQWTTHIGSVLRLQFGGIDIPLNWDQVPGSRGNYNLYVTVSIKNQTDRIITPKLNVLLINEGVMNVSNKVFSTSVGLITPDIIMQLKEQEPMAWERNDTFSGGGINWSKVGEFLKKLVRPGINLARKIIPGPIGQSAVDFADTVAKSYGLGVRKGGKLISKSQMKDLTF